MVDSGERWRGSPEARPADWIWLALSKRGRGRHGEAHGPVGLVGGSSEKAGDKGYRGGVFIGAREESDSRGYFRRGSGLGASRDYGEAFASVNLTGEQWGWALHGEL